MLETDFLQRIVNVSWGAKGIFVAGDFAGNVFYCDPQPKAENKNSLQWVKIKPAETFTIAVGSSYGVIGKTEENKGKSVFVMVGQLYAPEDEVSSGLSIVSSYDGQTWTETLHEPNVYPDVESEWIIERTACGVVWDKDAFYFAASQTRRRTISLPTLQEDNERGEVLYRSSDGFSWSIVAETNIPATDFGSGWPGYTWPEPSMILAHCKKPENDDGKMCDGRYGYAKTTDTRMKPGAPMEYHTWVGPIFLPPGSGGEGTPTVKIEDNVEGTGGVELGSGTVSMPCKCVAHAGSVWVAGGGSTSSDDINQRNKRLDASFDKGETWINTLNETSSEGPILTIIGGTVIKAK